MGASEPQPGPKQDDSSDRLYQAAERVRLEQASDTKRVLTPEELLYRTLADNPLLKLALFFDVLREAGTTLLRWLRTKRTAWL